MRKFRFLVLVSFFIISILTLTRTGAAMNNPELIRWKAPDFNQFTVSAFRAVFGPDPSQSDWTYVNRFRENNMRYELFIALISSKRYINLYGHLEKKYSVWWKTRTIDSNTGPQVCHCYYFSDFSQGGYIPNMQYIGKTLPAGNLNYGVARALTLYCAAADKYTCPHFDCGFTGTDSSNNAVNNNPTSIGTNLVGQPNFSGFNNQPGPWLRWSSSRTNQSFAKAVTLNKGKIKTALYIKNLSGRGPQIYGTTSQRISVQKGYKYQITFYGYTKGSGSSYGGIVISIDPLWKIRPIMMNKKTNGWERFSGVFTAQANYMDLRIISEDRGEVWITAMSLIPLSNGYVPHNNENIFRPDNSTGYNRTTNDNGYLPEMRKPDWAGTWSVTSLHKSGPAKGRRISSEFSVIISPTSSYVLWNKNKWNCIVSGNTLRFNGKHSSGGDIAWTFVRDGNTLEKDRSTFRGTISGQSASGIYNGYKISNR